VPNCVDLQKGHSSPSTLRFAKAKAPASLMLFGEHAVLRGSSALVAAIDQWLQVEIIPRCDEMILIESNLGEATTSMQHLQKGVISLPKQFSFLEVALSTLSKELLQKSKNGFTCTINSEFASTIGLGSSAAFVVALLAALSYAAEWEWDAITLHKRALNVIRSVQGRGSGADLAASIFGGVIDYSYEKIERVARSISLVVLYSGYKTPTSIVIQHVDALEKGAKEHVTYLLQVLASASNEAKRALIRSDLPALGLQANRAQSAMEELSLACPKILELIALLQSVPTIHGAKISGSGLGDCVIGFGEAESLVLPSWASYVPVRVSTKGVQVSGLVGGAGQGELIR
jgi:mevalonate kinase